MIVPSAEGMLVAGSQWRNVAVSTLGSFFRLFNPSLALRVLPSSCSNGRNLEGRCTRLISLNLSFKPRSTIRGDGTGFGPAEPRIGRG
jgi:hypothetical protein